jgi:hypothetical protein
MSYNQNPYAGMDRAEIGEGGGKYISKLGVGRFSFRIIRALMKSTRRSGDQTIVELELIESSKPNEPLGQKVAWFQPHSNKDMLLKNLKTFAAAALGYYYPDDKDRIERELSPHVVDLWVRATSPENILCGKCITSDNSEYTTRDTKEERIIPNWSPFEGVEPPAYAQPVYPPAGPPGPPQPVWNGYAWVLPR